jgi:hypothetical protein
MTYDRSKVAAAAARIADDLQRGPNEPLGILPVVGLKELARMFVVGDNTPYQWRVRGQLPPHDALLSGNPYWRLPTIYDWAETTNRLIKWDPWDVVAPSEGDMWGKDADPIDQARPVGAVA